MVLGLLLGAVVIVSLSTIGGVLVLSLVGGLNAPAYVVTIVGLSTPILVGLMGVIAKMLGTSSGDTADREIRERRVIKKLAEAEVRQAEEHQRLAGGTHESDE